MRPELRRLLWALAAVFAVHEAEEWNLVTWLQAHFTPEPGFTDLGARTLLVLFASLAVSFTVLAARFLSERAAVVALAPLFLSVVLGNALTHLFWCIYFRGYAPGIITSLALIPLALAFARLTLREHLAPRVYVWVLLGLSLLQPIAAALAGSHLSAQQISLQAWGNRLALWLWGAV